MDPSKATLECQDMDWIYKKATLGMPGEVGSIPIPPEMPADNHSGMPKQELDL